MKKKSAKIVSLIEKAQKINSDKVKTLQSFIACLFYLSQEAEREAFSDIAVILKECIGKIDLLSRGGFLQPPTCELLDESLYEAMNFLHELAEFSPAGRREFMKVFDALRRTLFIGENRLPRREEEETMAAPQ
jgi:hypothetical protein